MLRANPTEQQITELHPTTQVPPLRHLELEDDEQPLVSEVPESGESRLLKSKKVSEIKLVEKKIIPVGSLPQAPPCHGLTALTSSLPAKA